jgi:hypothetical protein
MNREYCFSHAVLQSCGLAVLKGKGYSELRREHQSYAESKLCGPLWFSGFPLCNLFIKSEIVHPTSEISLKSWSPGNKIT